MPTPAQAAADGHARVHELEGSTTLLERLGDGYATLLADHHGIVDGLGTWRVADLSDHMGRALYGKRRLADAERVGLGPVRPPREDRQGPMEPHDVRIFPTAADFRAWLEEHHGTATELWIGYYKKGVPKTSMTYAEAVDEALCFGWIDGQARRIDDEVTSQRFTPRRATSSWSAINIAKVAELKAAGRMHPAGIRAFEERDRRRDAADAAERPQELPPEMLERFKRDDAAWGYWESETPSYRRTVTYWVLSAKRPETRERRFATLVADSASGRRVGPMIVDRSENKAASPVNRRRSPAG